MHTKARGGGGTPLYKLYRYVWPQRVGYGRYGKSMENHIFWSEIG